MRDIKFRAWDKEHKEIIYDIPLSTINFYGSLNDFFDKSELMQYTGLKDKNGTEIYEGDILINREPRNPYHPANQIYEVVYGQIERYEGGTIPHEGFVGFSFKSHTPGLNTVFEENEIEVIGNIYENPELLDSMED